MEKPTAKDGAKFLAHRFNDIWDERKLGDHPTIYFSEGDNIANISMVSHKGMTPFITVNEDCIAVGTKPKMEEVDLNDGKQFYDLIDRLILDVI